MKTELRHRIIETWNWVAWSLLCLLFVVVTGTRAQGQQAAPQDVIAALKAARYKEALAIVEPLIQETPWNPQLWTLKGIALASAGRPKEALASFRKAIQLRPDSLAALQGAAEIEFHSKDTRAKATLEKILSIQPDNHTAQSMLGVIAYDNQDCRTAVGYFDKSRAAVESNPASLWRYGHCLLVVRRPADAVRAFRKLQTAAPVGTQATYALSVALYESGQFAEAAQTLRPLADKKEPAADVLSLIADAYEANHQTPEALESLKRAIGRYPYRELLYIALADLCMEHGSYELGLEVLKVGAKNIPKSARIRAMQGVIHAQLGQYDKAEETFDQAADLDPGDVPARMGQTLTLQETGRVDESIELLRQQIRQNPGDPATNFFLAQALLRKGIQPGEAEFDEAIQCLRKTVTADPAQVAARVDLGKLLVKTGEIDKAAVYLEEAVKLNPANRTATYQLMRCYRRLGRSQEALSLMSKLRNQLEKGMEDDVKTNRYKLVKAGPR